MTHPVAAGASAGSLSMMPGNSMEEAQPSTPPEESAEPRSQPKIEVLPVGDPHDAAVAEFFRKVWSETATADVVRAGRTSNDNPAAPGGVVPSFAFLMDDVVVGYIGTIPTRFASPMRLRH